MKKLIIKSISLVLILILTALMMFSCKLIENLFDFDLVYRGDPNGIYPDGYTGGFGINGQWSEEIWWVETYEECLAAIEQLKAHGSTFSDDALFVYEGDAFDVKYCFNFSGKDDRIEFGDNPFDRYAKDIHITTYAFFDDVTIDEINYSLLKYYEVYQFGTNLTSQNAYDIPIEESIVSDWIVASKADIYLEAKCNDIQVLVVRPRFFREVDSFRMTPEVIYEMLENGRVEIYDNKE